MRLGELLGALYGSIGFGLGAIYTFCATVQTVWCRAGKVFILFFPSTLLGSPVVSLLDFLPFGIALSVALIANSFVFGVVGHFLEKTIRAFLKRN